MSSAEAQAGACQGDDKNSEVAPLTPRRAHARLHHPKLHGSVAEEAPDGARRVCSGPCSSSSFLCSNVRFWRFFPWLFVFLLVVYCPSDFVRYNAHLFRIRGSDRSGSNVDLGSFTFSSDGLARSGPSGDHHPEQFELHQDHHPVKEVPSH